MEKRSGSAAQAPTTDPLPAEVVVHVVGAVRNPGGGLSRRGPWLAQVAIALPDVEEKLRCGLLQVRRLECLQRLVIVGQVVLLHALLVQHLCFSDGSILRGAAWADCRENQHKGNDRASSSASHRFITSKGPSQPN